MKYCPDCRTELLEHVGRMWKCPTCLCFFKAITGFERIPLTTPTP